MQATSIKVKIPKITPTFHDEVEMGEDDVKGELIFEAAKRFLGESWNNETPRKH